MAYNHFFNNRTFWLVGFDDARAQQIKETIVDNGGSVVFKLDSETTYCVATPSEMENVENILHGVHDLDVIIIKEEDIWKNGCRDTDRRGNNSGGSNSNSRNDQRTASETSTRSRNRSIPEYDGDDYFGQSHNRNRQSTNRHRSRSRTSGTVRTPSIIHSPLNGDDEHSGNLKRTNSDTHSFRTHRRHSSSAGTSGGLFGEQSDQHDNNNIEEDDDGQQNNFKSSTHSRLHRSRSDDDSNSNQSWQGDDEDEDEDGNANVSRLSIRMQDGDNEDDEDDGDGDEEEILEEEDEDDEDDDEDVLGNENEAIANHNNQDELIEDSKHQYQSKTTQNLNRSTTERNSNNSVSTDAIDQLSHSLEVTTLSSPNMGKEGRRASLAMSTMNDNGHDAVHRPNLMHKGHKSVPTTSSSTGQHLNQQSSPATPPRQSHSYSGASKHRGEQGRTHREHRHRRRPSATRPLLAAGNYFRDQDREPLLPSSSATILAANKAKGQLPTEPVSDPSLPTTFHPYYIRQGGKEIDPDSDYFEEEDFSELDDGNYTDYTSSDEDPGSDGQGPLISDTAAMSSSITSLNETTTSATVETKPEALLGSPPQLATTNNQLEAEDTKKQSKSPSLPADLLQPTANKRLSAITDNADGDYIDYQQERQERLEWQSMLTSVLTGEVIRSEKRRLSSNTNAREQAAELHNQIWIGLRAIVRGRTLAEERRFVAEARSHVDTLLERVMAFQVRPGPHDALEQVTELLQNVDAAERLWPHRKAMMSDQPIYASPEFQRSLDTLNSWCTVTKSLQMQLKILRNWTGSDTLQVSTRTIVNASETSTHDTPMATVADEPTFVERIMKENGLQNTFEKSTLASLSRLLQRAKHDQTENAESFARMGLPNYIEELAILIAFPLNLMEQFLRLRLEYAKHLTDPTMVIVDQLMEDARTSLQFATVIKNEVADLTKEAPGWSIPSCIEPSYDKVMLQTLEFYFRLLTWKLKGGSKAVYFKEAEILENEWGFISKIVVFINGGEWECARQISKLHTRLLLRVLAYHNSQVYSPPERPEGGLVRWYTRVLDSVRLRARRLYRFGRHVHIRMENAGEYNYSLNGLPMLLDALAQTDHCLVYTGTLESRGMYLIVSNSLAGDATRIEEVLNYCTISPCETYNEDSADDRYALVIAAPSEYFQWEGSVMEAPMSTNEISVKMNRVRIIAEQPSCLPDCKRVFLDRSGDVDLSTAVMHRINIRTVNLQHQRMKRTAHRLCQAFIHGATEIRRRTIGESNRCDLIQSWYSFSVEYTQRIIRTMEHGARQSLARRMSQLAVNWVTFVCEDCDPDDRKTFRWAMNALEFAMTATRGNFILLMNDDEFAQLRVMVAGCMSLLITHVDVHGARSSFEARAAELERRQALEDAMVAEAARDKGPRKPLSRSRSIVVLNKTVSVPNSPADSNVITANIPSSNPNDTTSNAMIKIDDDTDEQAVLDSVRASNILSTISSFMSGGAGIYHGAENSLMYVRDEWLRQLKDLEQRRARQQQQSHMIGRVLDDDRPEDRDLVFLASSSSNISLRWQQGKYIGGGTFGSVYLAINLESGELMAVKEVRFQDASSLSAMYKSTRDEMTVMELLDHPNIVSYYGMEVHRDKVFIFMECCQGGSLTALLENGRIEDENVVRVYTVQMLRGAAYLHANNIVHRDIKPDNVLLDEKGNIKFVDFGAAKMIANNQKTFAQSTLNKSSKQSDMKMGTLTGTPMYMAPEVITGGEKGRKGSQDIWSIGCCVLEMVTGHRPWHNLDNEWAVMYHVATGRPLMPDASQLSPLGIDFLKCCFNRSSATRATAQELLSHPWLKDVQITPVESNNNNNNAPQTPLCSSTVNSSISDQITMSSVSSNDNPLAMDSSIDTANNADLSFVKANEDVNAASAE